jgi:hypothetical protein
MASIAAPSIAAPSIATPSSSSIVSTPLINKGTGAGGANTNFHGKKFEEQTNNEHRLLKQGFNKVSINKTKYGYFLEKRIDDKRVVFVSQNGLKVYMKHFHDKNMFRCPDEAYIIYQDKNPVTIIKILEKKEQNVEGSVIDKLWDGPSCKREYQLVLGKEFQIEYAYCVSDFLKKKLTSCEKKFIILNQIHEESGIHILFGSNEDYFEAFELWLNSI